MQLSACIEPFRFGTKAENLLGLRNRLESAEVLDLAYFSVAEWCSDGERILKRVRAQFEAGRVVVRSSALAEDGSRKSMAGAFVSVLGVHTEGGEALRSAIERVVESMTGHPMDQVLVQPMLENVVVSGVIMTHDLVHGSPYYVIDFDDETGRTDCVTSGQGVHKSLRVYRDADPSHLSSPRVARFLALAKEIEAHCPGVPLDIEFALDRDDALYLLQARRIAVALRWHPVTERRVSRQLVFVESFVRQCSAPRPGLYGARTILGVMPDWNPAEIIGTAPRPLATSLYRHLITRDVWREARQTMGYRRLPADELMVVINSRPYIDVRASLNSFLPEGIDPDAAALLVDAWLARLASHPELHDKIEFEVAITCLDFCFDRVLDDRYPGLLTAPMRTHFRALLRSLTQAAITGSGAGSLAQAEASCAQLDALREPDAHPEPFQALTRAIRRLRDCRTLGTLAFAVIARHAFIAETLLRSAVERDALRPESLHGFRRSVRTVTSGMLTDYTAIASGGLTREAFLDRFGHLRPGTYDITSLRYDQRDDLFSSSARLSIADQPRFVLSALEARSLDGLLKEAGLGRVEAPSLFEYARRAIAGREAAKFAFSRVLSDALELIARWGASQGLSRDDLSFLDWHALEQYAVDPAIDYADRHFLSLAAQGRQRHADAHAFHLSHLIRDERDIYVALQHRSAANFIGVHRVSGPVVELTPDTDATVNLYQTIVLIENADPGYDWVFTRGIRGLVTKFGGANSHMAIRCAELDIPAAIGCGEQSYRRLVQVGAADLDCAARVLRALNAD